MAETFEAILGSRTYATSSFRRAYLTVEFTLRTTSFPATATLPPRFAGITDLDFIRRKTTENVNKQSRSTSYNEKLSIEIVNLKVSTLGGKSFQYTVFACLKTKRQANLHMKLFSWIMIYEKPELFYAIQVGANRGEDFVKGKSLDDPIVEVVVENRTRGILVEAVPQNYNILLKNTAEYRKRFVCLNAAVNFPKLSEESMFHMINTSRVL